MKSGKKPGMATQAKVRATKPKGSKPTGEGGGNRSRKPPAKPGATSGLTEEMKAKLKSKLGEVKKRVHGAGDKDGDKQSRDAEVVDDSEEDGSEGYRPTSSEAGDAKLTTGAALVAARPELALAESPSHRKDGKVATKERSSKSLTQQLLRRAMDMNQKRKKGTKKKKEKKSKEGRVAELLTQILTKGSKDEKGKKRKKDKKKRKVIDGVIVSCSDSSESISGITSESDSETDLETPMKKKSRDKPGSVLSLLTEHVRDQMDQAALSDLPGRDHRVTSGIKILSYFTMHIKPQFPSYQRELREMNTLAATLDLLRTGDIARVGDSLSARFMAIHQSMIDQSWSTAKFMELHNMDDSSAASASLVLASRKHSKLVERVQGKGWQHWGYGNPRIKGKGKGDRKGSDGDFKGEKGKGKKGKNKDKQWDKKVDAWDTSKEKGDEKWVD